MLDLYKHFTNTELQVLLGCLDNKRCKAIADELGISVETVKKHRKNIARKLGVSGKTAFRQALSQLETEGFASLLRTKLTGMYRAKEVATAAPE
ncbi:helix-turn-helix transcriptional regulator [Spirosoma montaniterrae]|uniref:HTH luxR-type domain-containing protein n=1 Tax=Spirosoma montaniterrae TaxID=1178516 RepID=A0A1P9WSY3_9BACT|nr:helix-turn-helix transcriptional regulator [Spirosoma montaniterrae]AQG78472.1 hypothetical protein AWR27_03430 [Spirosoma montaniterrae]